MARKVDAATGRPRTLSDVEREIAELEKVRDSVLPTNQAIAQINAARDAAAAKLQEEWSQFKAAHLPDEVARLRAVEEDRLRRRALAPLADRFGIDAKRKEIADVASSEIWAVQEEAKRIARIAALERKYSSRPKAPGHVEETELASLRHLKARGPVKAVECPTHPQHREYVGYGQRNPERTVRL